MKNKSFLLLVLNSVGLLLSGNAYAHTFGAHGAGFMAGLIHPFMGLDHLLAMLAVGLWSTQLGGKALWRLPVTFMTFMAGGALLAQLELNGVWIETGIAASVIILGGLIAGKTRLSTIWSTSLIALFAIFHGYAHGLEIPQTSIPLAYALGFLLATATLHGLGVGLGLQVKHLQHAYRMSGAAIAATGLVLLISQQL